MTINPDIQQLNDHNFLVMVAEEQLPFCVADMDNCGFSQPGTLGEYQWWIEWKERQMIAATKAMIMRDTHVGAVLRTLPKRSHVKYGLSLKSSEHDYRFGFRVRIRNKRHVILFKLALV
jgi:hypothetical protein